MLIAFSPLEITVNIEYNKDIMARQCRLDWTGAVHHVMARGVGKCLIFLDTDDKRNFVRRLSGLVEECGISLMAWALMPNHVHLLSRTGPVSQGKFMQRLLTGYAGYLNRKYDRVGHLFQNRFKSILVQEELYLLQLVRYIHLNPLRAGLTGGIQELLTYPWCGHAGIAGARKMPWLDSEAVLDHFDGNIDERHAGYLEFIAATPDEESDSLLEFGNFRIGLRGLSRINPLENHDCHRVYNILGSREFGTAILRKFESSRGYLSRSRGREHSEVEAVLRLIEGSCGLLKGALASPRRTQEVVIARDLASYVLQKKVGLSLSDTARVLGKTPASVRQATDRATIAISSGDLMFENILIELYKIIGHKTQETYYVP
jgi:putative transposase